MAQRRTAVTSTKTGNGHVTGARRDGHGAEPVLKQRGRELQAFGTIAACPTASRPRSSNRSSTR